MYKVYITQKYTQFTTAYLRVSYYSHNKEKIFPYAELAVSSLKSYGFCLLRGTA